MNIVAQDLESRLQSRIVDYFPSLNGEKVRVHLVAVKRATYSTVYLYRTRGLRRGEKHRGVVVKVFSKRGTWNQLSQRQYTVLCTVWPMFQSSQMFSLPRPLEFLHDPPALVMEEMTGKRLQDLFNPLSSSGMLFVHRVVRASRNCGEWLRYFHEATRSSACVLDLKQKSANAVTNLIRLEKYGFSSDLLYRVSEALHKEASDLNDVYLPASLVHGDFTIDNILIGKERVCVLDLTGNDENAIYHDLATFLNSLLLLKISGPISTTLLRDCRTSFLFGYFGNGHYNRAALNFLSLTGLISVALEILDRRSSQPVARWWVRRVVECTLWSAINDRGF